MARKRSSAADDLLAIFAKLPWWAGVACAVAAWVGFSLVTDRFAGSVQPHHIVFAQFAGLARWGVPLVCLMGALMSVLSRRKRAGLLASASGGGGAAAIAGMSWAEFEMLVGESFRVRGYTVKETGGGGSAGAPVHEAHPSERPPGSDRQRRPRSVFLQACPGSRSSSPPRGRSAARALRRSTLEPAVDIIRGLRPNGFGSEG